MHLPSTSYNQSNGIWCQCLVFLILTLSIELLCLFIDLTGGQVFGGPLNTPSVHIGAPGPSTLPCPGWQASWSTWA